MRKFLLFFVFFGTKIATSQTNLLWAKQIGGIQQDIIKASGVDPLGNVYTTGTFSGTADFDPNSGTYNLTSSGGQNIHVTKLDPSGNFVWAKQIASGGSGFANSIFIDASGNSYIAGTFGGIADFDPGPGTYTLNSTLGNAFVLKLDGSGGFVWAKNYGGNVSAASITVDGLGYVYTTGCFYNTADLDPGPGTYNFTSTSQYDIFISKLDPSGVFVWAKHFNGSGNSTAYAVSVDAMNNVYTTGFYTGTVDFDPGAGTCNFSNTWGRDIFISKLNSAGNFVWAKQITGSLTGGDKYAFSIKADNLGFVYTTGQFLGTVDFDPGLSSYTLASVAGSDDIFIHKLDSSGNFIWARQFGGKKGESGLSICTDNIGNIYTTGLFTDTVDFDPGIGIYNLSAPINIVNTFISKLDAAGSMMWTKQIGGSSFTYGYSIATDNSGNVFLSGKFKNTVDFDPEANVFNLSSFGTNSQDDAYILKLSNTVGIDENESEGNTIIYPNPANSILNIKSESGLGRSVISITDVLGKTLLETKNDNLYNQTLNIESLSSGVYFLNIKSEKGQSVKKFVKQ